MGGVLDYAKGVSKSFFHRGWKQRKRRDSGSYTEQCKTKAEVMDILSRGVSEWSWRTILQDASNEASKRTDNKVRKLFEKMLKATEPTTGQVQQECVVDIESVQEQRVGCGPKPSSPDLLLKSFLPDAPTGLEDVESEPEEADSASSSAEAEDPVSFLMELD